MRGHTLSNSFNVVGILTFNLFVNLESNFEQQSISGVRGSGGTKAVKAKFPRRAARHFPTLFVGAPHVTPGQEGASARASNTDSQLDAVIAD
jgi:hypothetical protein